MTMRILHCYEYAVNLCTNAYRGFTTASEEVCGKVHAYVGQYFTCETPDPDLDYYFEKKKGQLVLLEGQAKGWAIRCQALENENAFWKRVSKATFLLAGMFSYQAGLWRHDLLVCATVLPLWYMNKWVKAGVDRYYHTQVSSLKQLISEIVWEEPTIPRERVEAKQREPHDPRS